MPTFSPGVQKLGTQAKRAAVEVRNAFPATMEKVFGITSKAGGVGASTLGKAGAAGTSVADKAAGMLSYAFRPITWAAKKFPVLTAGTVVATGALVVKGHYDKKRDRAADEFQARQQLTHMAVTNPQEYALLMERMRGANPKDAPSFVQAEMKRRDDMAQAAKQ